MTIASLLAYVFLSISSLAMVTNETTAAARRLGADSVSDVEFSPGQTELDETAKKQIDDFVRDARQANPIREATVLAWPDKEYPKPSAHSTTADIELAKLRGQQIRNYLSDSAGLNQVKVFNMAERPNAMQEILKTPTATTKKTLETAGAAPTSERGTGIFGEKGKKSTAMILLYK